MNGPASYSSFDSSGSNDPRNIGAGRGVPIGTLIHTTAGTSSLDWLTGGSARAGSPASADYLIDRNGTRHALCPDGHYPYHAGQSHAVINGRTYQGDELSAALVGVELELQYPQWATYAQIDSLADLIVCITLRYSWRWPYTLLGHYEVATPVGRREDPEGFPWGDFMGRLYARALAASVGGL